MILVWNYKQVVWITSLLLVMVTCWLACSTNVAGGGAGTEDGNSQINGIITDSSGSPISGVKITLTSQNYRVGSEDSTQILYTSIGNSEGKFELLKLNEGTYNLYASDSVTQLTLFIPGLSLKKDSTITIDERAKAPSNLTIYLDPLEAEIGSQIYLPGTPLSLTLDSEDLNSGKIILKIPEGHFENVTLTNGNGTAAKNILKSEIDLISAENRIIGPFYSWQYTSTLTLSTSGNGYELKEDLVTYPILIRLESTHSPSNFSFASTLTKGKDVRFSKPDGTILPTEIELWDGPSEIAVIWVLLDTLKGNSDSQQVHMFWGNANPNDAVDNKVFKNDSSYLSVWHLNENIKSDSIPVVMDKGINNNNLSSFGAMADSNSVPGLIGKALKFDGVDDHLKGISSYTGPFTISLWANTDNLLQNRYSGIFASNDSSADTSFQIDVGFNSDSIRFYRWYPDNDDIRDSGRIGFEIFNIEPNYQFITVSFEYPNFQIYHNGVSVTQGTLGYPLNFHEFKIGMNRKNDFAFEGSIDEVRISNVVRSESWVRMNYETQKVGSGVVKF